MSREPLIASPSSRQNKPPIVVEAQAYSEPEPVYQAPYRPNYSRDDELIIMTDRSGRRYLPLLSVIIISSSSLE